MEILVYRPGCARRDTVFENQLNLYAYIQSQTECRFTIVCDQSEYREDPRFKWVRLEVSDWKSFRGRRFFWRKRQKLQQLASLCNACDLIITLDPTVYTQAHLVFDAARKTGKRVWFDATITLQSELPFTRWNWNGAKRVQADVEYAERILIPSPKVIERFAHLGLLSQGVEKKFWLLGHAIDVDRFTPSTGRSMERKRILCVSRLVPEKGIAYIVEAFLQILKSHPDTELVFLGRGVMEEYIRNRVPSEALNVRIFIRDCVRHDMLHSEFQKGAIYVSHALESPEWEEYFGVANLEAMSCGLVPLITPTGAVPFVLGSAQPVWVSPRDVGGLRKALVQALNSTEEEYSELLEQNRRFVVENYSITSVANRWLRAL